MRKAARLYLRRFLKRAAVCVLVPVLLVAGLRIAWGIQASIRLQHVRDKLHTQGYRVYPSDFPGDAGIPHDLNGFYDFLAACKEYRGLSPARQQVLRIDAPPPRSVISGHDPLMERMEWLQPVCLLLDASERRQVMVWPWQTRNSDEMSHNLGAYSSLFYSLLRVAEATADRGDAATAYTFYRRAAFVCRVGRDSNVISPWLGELYAPPLLGSLLTGDRIATLPDAAALADAKRILSLLCDDRPFHENIALGAAGELTRRFELISEQADKKPFLLRPAVWSTLAYQAEVTPFYLANLTEQYVLRASSLEMKMARASDHRSRVDDVILGYRGIIDYWNQPRKDVEADACLVLVAARLHEVFHGKLPENARALVPEFLPKVPIDRYSERGEPLHYGVEGGAPMVWSVGVNGVDDGGAAGPVPGKELDIVFRRNGLP